MTDDPSMKDKAAESAQAGKDAASDLASTATDKAQEVAQQAKGQARNLVGEARGQLRSQAGDQQRTAVTNLRSLGDELQAMTTNSETNGLAADLASQAADRAHGVADWLDGREPEDLLDEVRRFARKRPGAFLLGALAAGVVAGRLTRGAVAEHQDDSPSEISPSVPDSTEERIPGNQFTADGGRHTANGVVAAYPDGVDALPGGLR